MTEKNQYKTSIFKNITIQVFFINKDYFMNHFYYFTCYVYLEA